MAAQLLPNSKWATPLARRSSVARRAPHRAITPAHLRCRASGSDSGKSSPPLAAAERNGAPQGILMDSDLSFVGKLVAVSFAGALVIKYGSLLISLPFEPSGAVATAVVIGTPALYSLYLLTQSSKQQ